MIELCKKRSNPSGNDIITRTSKKNGYGTRRGFRDMPNSRLCVTTSDDGTGVSTMLASYIGIGHLLDVNSKTGIQIT